MLLSLGAASLAAGPATLIKGLGLAHAQGRPLTFCSWGGALSELEKTALLDPFAKTKRIEIAYASPTNYAKIKAMVEGGAPEWDLVTGRRPLPRPGQDPLETLDMSLIPNAKRLDPGWVSSRGIFTSTGATVIAWNTKAFPEDKGRQRGRTSGTSRHSRGRAVCTSSSIQLRGSAPRRRHAENQIYPVTDDKMKVVFEKLREIKPNVKVWWTAGAQPPQLLSSGELALCSAWTGRILAVMKENAPVAMTYADGVAWGNAWVVLKGSPHAKMAMEAINYAISDEAQMRLLDAGTYGRR
jgi:putative spermidine/putrescine transport system substrate-binding protein